MELDAIEGVGNLAYVRGSCEMPMIIERAPEPVRDRGEFLEILRKAAAGRCLIASISQFELSSADDKLDVGSRRQAREFQRLSVKRGADDLSTAGSCTASIDLWTVDIPCL